MDFIQHFGHGFMAGALTGYTAEQSVAVGIAGTLPDIIGYGAQVQSDSWLDYTDWTVYNMVHSLQWVMYTLVISIALCVYFQIPLILLAWGAWAFHVLTDKLFHLPGWRWWMKDEGLYFEILGWVITISLFIFWLVL